MIRHSLHLVAAATVFAGSVDAMPQGTPELYEQHTHFTAPAGAQLDLLTDLSFVARFGAGPQTIINYLPENDCVGWGDHPDNSDPTSPNFNTYRLEGMVVNCLDTDGSTPTRIVLEIWAEDPTAVGQPVPVPTLQSIARWTYNLDFAAPAGTPAGGFVNFTFPDTFVPRGTGGVFLGIEIPAETSATDTFLVGFLSSTDPNPTPPPTPPFDWDVPGGNASTIGHGGGTRGGFGYVINNATGAFSFTEELPVITALGQQSLFVVSAETNQASMPNSNPISLNPMADPGSTSSAFSARNPALITDIDGNTRSDNLAFRLQNENFDGSELVAVLFSSLSPTPIDLSLVDPSWEGFLCLSGNPTQLALGAPDATTGVFTANLQFPMASRAGLLGLEFGWWAVALDFVNSRVIAAPCSATQF